MTVQQARDPFIPRPPDPNDIGRMWSRRGLRPSWPCRWCKRALFARRGIVLCLHCDMVNGDPA